MPSLRLLTEADFPRLIELTNLFELEPLTLPTFSGYEAKAHPERVMERQAALDETGAVVGFSESIRNPWMPPGRFWVWGVVDPNHRRQGHGGRLLDQATGFARAQGATTLASIVRDDDPDALQFMRKQGFVQEAHTINSRLELTTFDESRFAPWLEALRAKGFRFFTMANLGNSLEAQQKLYELNRLVALDNPGNTTGTFQAFDAFARNVFGAHWYRPEGQILAAHGERWVGLSAVGWLEESGAALTAFTGTLREYRGRGLAKALKVLATQTVVGWGARHIRTNNDSRNEPMLAINRALGYIREPGIYRLIKEL